MKSVCRAYAIALSILSFGTSGRADIIAASHKDFSIAGFTTPTGVQNTVNGFNYGVYPGGTGTAGVFTTNDFSASPSEFGGSWNGADGSGTPAVSKLDMHPGLSQSTAVRRYTVAAGGEPLPAGPVRVVGRFFDLNSGLTHGFVALDPDGEDGAGTRNVIAGPAEINLAKSWSFDETVNVSPGATIDFGVLSAGDAYSDSTGFIGWIVDGNTAVPTNLVSSPLASAHYAYFNGYQDLRGLCQVMATDGVTGGTDATTFELTGGGYPYQYGGLLYLEKTGSGKATRFDSMRIDVTSANDFAQAPQLYLLRHNSDPGSINPVADDRYERLPVQAVRQSSNSTGQPYYTAAH